MPRGSNFQRPYPPEFRREAVELYRRAGKPLREIAVDLGVSTEALRIWVRQAQVDEGSVERPASNERFKVENEDDRPRRERSSALRTGQAGMKCSQDLSQVLLESSPTKHVSDPNAARVGSLDRASAVCRVALTRDTTQPSPGKRGSARPCCGT
jgi:transposase